MTTKFTAAALAGALAIVVSAAAATVAFDFAATPAFAQDKKDTMGKELHEQGFHEQGLNGQRHHEQGRDEKGRHEEVTREVA